MVKKKAQEWMWGVFPLAADLYITILLKVFF